MFFGQNYTATLNLQIFDDLKFTGELVEMGDFCNLFCNVFPVIY